MTAHPRARTSTRDTAIQTPSRLRPASTCSPPRMRCHPLSRPRARPRRHPPARRRTSASPRASIASLVAPSLRYSSSRSGARVASSRAFVRSFLRSDPIGPDRDRSTRSIARFVDSNRRIRETPRRDECASTRDLDAREDASARAVVRGGKRREKNMKTRARARASSDGRPCGNAACGTKVGVTEATARAIGVGGFLDD